MRAVDIGWVVTTQTTFFGGVGWGGKPLVDDRSSADLPSVGVLHQDLNGQDMSGLPQPILVPLEPHYWLCH